MHIDARNIDNNSVIEGDICIVGAGAAGISMALELDKQNLKVILLEGGDFEYDDRVQELYRGKITGQPYYPLKSARLHMFGGTTGHWGGLCSTFEPQTFLKRDWVPRSGWPFSADELNPYYRRAHDRLELGEYNFSVDRWLKESDSLEMLPVDKNVFYHKIWRFCIPEAMKFGKKFRDRIVHSPNIQLYTYANAVDIRANDNLSQVTEIVVKNYTGKTHTVRARYFALACCSIQNSRLLLASNSQAPAGLGNENDHVGRHFMENIELKSAELWLGKKSTMQFYLQNKPNFRAELAISLKMQQEEQLLNGMLSFNPLSIARKTPPFIETWTDDDPRQNRKKMDTIYTRNEESRLEKLFDSNKHDSFEITLRLEQVPNPDSRVTLDPEEKDSLGVPRAKLNWAFTDMEKRSARRLYELFGRQVGQAGIGRVKLEESLADEKNSAMPSTTSGGWHHMGTTRMSDDPKQGVVDAHCRVHSLENLFIAGSSCFSTGSAVNPTFTIVALSIRLADHLKQKMLLT